MVEWLGQSRIGLRSLTEAIDTTTSSGRLILSIMGALAEFERSLIVERTQAGLAAARRRGVKVGRPRKLSDHHLAHARALLDGGTETRASVARLLGVDAKTLWRALAADEYTNIKRGEGAGDPSRDIATGHPTPPKPLD